MVECVVLGNAVDKTVPEHFQHEYSYKINIALVSTC